MEKNKNVPKLRFPEFTGEWEEKKLGEIAEKIIYGMNAAATSYDGQNKYLRITDIDESSRSFTPKPLTSPDGLIEDKYRLSEGDLVFARTGASVGKSYLYNKSDGNLYFAGFLIRFTILNENPYFIYAQTLKESFNKWVQLMSMRSGQPGINAEEYKTLPIFLPSLPEQIKIASFLTAVDEKLTQLKKKKTLLEQYKKGIMQKLFSQELRFKDNNNQDFPDWQVKKLGEVGDIVPGLTYNPSDINLNGVLVLRSSNIKDSLLSFEDNVYVETNNFNPVKENDILICVRNGSKSLIGKNALITKENEGLAFGAFMVVYRSPMNLFIFQLFATEKYYKIINENLGATINSINNSDLRKFEFQFPSLPEQQKIANFLSSIDEKISHCRKQIEKMETWKKGLLQQMFC